MKSSSSSYTIPSRRLPSAFNEVSGQANGRNGSLPPSPRPEGDFPVSRDRLRFYRCSSLLTYAFMIRSMKLQIRHLLDIDQLHHLFLVWFEISKMVVSKF